MKFSNYFYRLCVIYVHRQAVLSKKTSRRLIYSHFLGSDVMDKEWLTTYKTQKGAYVRKIDDLLRFVEKKAKKYYRAYRIDYKKIRIDENDLCSVARDYLIGTMKKYPNKPLDEYKKIISTVLDRQLFQFKEKGLKRRVEDVSLHEEDSDGVLFEDKLSIDGLLGDAKYTKEMFHSDLKDFLPKEEYDIFWKKHGHSISSREIAQEYGVHRATIDRKLQIIMDKVEKEFGL